MRIFLIFLLCLPWQPLLYAYATSDVCAKLPGPWDGTFRFKSRDDCIKYVGCTHSLHANIVPLAPGNFKAEAEPEFGGARPYLLTCRGGQITAETGRANTIRYACTTDKTCIIRYDDSQVAVALIMTR